MQVVTNVNTDVSRGRQVQSRKDQDGQSAVIKMGEVKDKVEYLVQLLEASKASANTYGEAIKAIAEKSGLQSSVIRKFIAAKASEKFEDRKRDVEQSQLLFDEIGG